ncbi:molybdopterin molybdotransferase MoeA [Pseudogemmobacter sp. W21_MBD1_M6]|uniref:molybdopterin molybdotransferase MoeA n=1 Tax=Pseudogemmobacter sp. W21_MBD1_M6 TaxID=3240271 RepID=UPI003F9566C4
MQPGLMSVDQAIAAALRFVVPVSDRKVVPLAGASGRVLALPVVARAMLPPYDASAMDGYAVRVNDMPGAGPWSMTVQDRIAAGDARSIALESGAALRIFTGAPLPHGADAVVMQESVTRRADGIHLVRCPTIGENIRRAGEEAPAGKSIVPAGRRLGPRDIGAAAAAGHATVTVTRRPRVALLTTGDEIVPPGSPLTHGAIWNANTSLLVAAIRAADAEIVTVKHAPDDLAALGALMVGLAGQVDMLITTGGVSVGEEDHCKAAILAAQGEIAVAGVAMKPGKPVMFGRVAGAVWLGLPGNPVSAYVTWQVLGLPLIARLVGNRTPAARSRLVVAGHPLHHRPGRCEYRPATITGIDHLGRQIVAAGGAVHSGRLSVLADADGLIVIPAATEAVQPGDLLDFLPFRAG